METAFVGYTHYNAVFYNISASQTAFTDFTFFVLSSTCAKYCVHLHIGYFYFSDVAACQKYPAASRSTVARNFLCVLRPTNYHFFPLSCPAGRANTYCRLFVGLCKMILSPPKTNSSRREDFLEAGTLVKTCKCQFIAECFDWLEEWVSTPVCLCF